MARVVAVGVEDDVVEVVEVEDDEDDELEIEDDDDEVVEVVDCVVEVEDDDDVPDERGWRFQIWFFPPVHVHICTTFPALKLPSVLSKHSPCPLHVIVTFPPFVMLPLGDTTHC